MKSVKVNREKKDTLKNLNLVDVLQNIGKKDINVFQTN